MEATETMKDFHAGYQAGFQAGRAALLAEIKAGGPFTYAYRYPEGITMRVRNQDPIEVIHLYRLPEEK